MHHLRRFISFFLLAALSLYVAPKEWMHELCEHEDTHDIICTDTCADHVSKAHHHCDILQLYSPPLYHCVNNFSFVFSRLIDVKPAVSAIDYHFSLTPFLFFRGPPVS